jgi:hypothetical protein
MSQQAIGAGAGANGTTSGNKAEILSKITEVFGLSKETAETFLQMMDVRTTAYPSETYFEELLNMIPVPKYFEQTVFSQKIPAEDELHVNQFNFSFSPTRFGRGAYGTVKPNKSRSQFVYKYMAVQNIDNEHIKKLLKEPLINLLLQEDSIGRSSVCKLYKVYCQPTYTTIRNNRGYGGLDESDYIYSRNLLGPTEEKVHTGYELIYKLENLGPPLEQVLRKIFKKKLGPENNLRILTKIYGPLFKALGYLREKYNFEHGDLHYNNLMLEKNPFLQDGTLDEKLLRVKMIDFGFSSIDYDSMKIGIPHPRLLKEVYMFLWAEENNLIDNTYTSAIVDKKQITEDEYKAMEKTIATESEKVMAGGKKMRRKTRKMKSRKNK